MTTTKLWLALLSFALLSQLDTSAQARFQLTFKGKYWTTNAAGTKIVSSPANTTTWLQDYVRTRGLTNKVKSLALAYHVNGGYPQGDSIDVVEKKTGNPVYDSMGSCVLYGLYLGTLYDRQVLASGDGKEIKMLQYVYNTRQNQWPAGSGIITERFYFDKNGNTNRTQITGNIQFLILPDEGHPLSHCIGAFVTGKQLP